MDLKLVSSSCNTNKITASKSVTQPNFGNMTIQRKALNAADSFVTSATKKNNPKLIAAGVLGAAAGMVAKIIPSKKETPYENIPQKLPKVELPELTAKLDEKYKEEYETLKKENNIDISESAYATVKEYNFEPYYLSYICQNITKENERILPELLAFDANGSSIGRALESINQNNNLDAFHYMINNTNLNERNFYLEGFSKLSRITDIINKTNDSTKNILPNFTKLCKYFSKEDLGKILSDINEENINSFNLLLSDDYNGNTFRFKETKSFSNSIYVSPERKNTETAEKFLKSVNKNNSELLSVLLYSKALKNESEVIDCLQKLQNEDIEILDKTLKMRNPSFALESIFDRTTGVADCVNALKNPQTKDIAKKLIRTNVFHEARMRFSDYNGIEELCKVLNENKDSKRIYKKVLAMKDIQKDQHRFAKVENITNVVKALSDPDKKDITEKILKIKTCSDQEYFLNDYAHSEALQKVDNDMDINRIKNILKAQNVYSKNTPAFNFANTIDIAASYKNIPDEDFPIPVANESDPTEYKKFLDIINCLQNDDINSVQIPVEDRIDFASKLHALQYDGMVSKQFDINKYLKLSSQLLGESKNLIEISKNDNINLFRNVIANKPEVDNLIKEFDFAQYGRNGLPLTYSRNQFIADLNKELDLLSDKERKNILAKLNITLTGDKKGYDNLLTFSELDSNIPAEARIKELCENFMMKNSIQTGDKNADIMLNSLIKGMPEFINVIGKQQHGSQNYSVDVHILQVLKHTMLQDGYDKLPDADKTAFKFAILMHDFGKREGIVDKKHPETSANMGKTIMNRYNLPKDVKSHVYKLIKGHHWLEEYNTKLKSPEQLSISFMLPNDYAMGKMMSYADLKSVNDRIFNAFKGALETSEQKRLSDAIQNNKETGIAIFTDKIVFKNRIPSVNYKGQDYKVIDFTRINDTEDMSKYGFAPNTKKSDLRFLVHQSSSTDTLNKIDYLSNINESGVISQSYISPNKKNTYRNQQFGVILDSQNTDIVNAFNMNQGSGYHKDENAIVDLITNPYSNLYRKYLPEKVAKELNISAQSYAELYEKIAEKKYLSQIKDDEKFEILERTILGSELKEVLKKTQDALLSSRYGHNEVITRNPKVAGFVAMVNSLEDIPEEYMQFVKDNNLTIYLFGEN